MHQSFDIANFWEWFASSAMQIHNAYHSEDFRWLNRQIAPRIALIADHLNWELGPYHAPDDTFVFSPTIRQNLTITRAAVSAAPKLHSWHFLPAKPPKQLLSLTFSLRDQTIHADDWKYRLISFNHGEFFDIEIFINAGSGFPITDEDTFCELVVEALIGEEMRLERVGYLLPKIIVDDNGIEKTTPIRFLKSHLDQVLSSHRI